MKIDLHNFFKYFDEKNPKHVAAVEQFEVDLADSPLLEDTANWVRIYRTPVEESKPKSNILEVPYYPQTDNYRDANRTCNSSACAMCLEYFKPGTLKGTKGDDAYIRKVFSIGDTADHLVQTRVLNSYGIKSSFHYHLSFTDLDRELDQQKPVVIGILHRGSLSHPTGGHMVVVVGKTPSGDYVVNDPYGSLNDNYTGSVYNGKGAIYKRSELERRWTPDGANSGWGRIFESPTNNTNEAKNTNEVPLVGINLIKEFEGFSSKAYYDPHTGLLPITIAYGSTRKIDGTPFHIGETMTKEEGEKLLIYQINKEFIPSLQKIPYWNEMNDKMKSAILDFAYNLGANFYGASGFNTITRVLREKKWDEVPAALELYRNPGSSVEAGLLRRRKREGLLWQEGLEDICYK